jgi:hypothetical protein
MQVGTVNSNGVVVQWIGNVRGIYYIVFTPSPAAISIFNVCILVYVKRECREQGNEIEPRKSKMEFLCKRIHMEESG